MWWWWTFWLSVHASKLLPRLNNNALSNTSTLCSIRFGSTCQGHWLHWNQKLTNSWAQNKVHDLKLVQCPRRLDALFSREPGIAWNMLNTSQKLGLPVSWCFVFFFQSWFGFYRESGFINWVYKIFFCVPSFISSCPSSGQRCPQQQVLRRSGLPLEGCWTGVGSTDF